MTKKDIFLKRKAEYEQVRAKAKEEKQFLDSCGECKVAKIPAKDLKFDGELAALFTNSDDERMRLRESMGGKGQAVPIIVTKDDFVIDGHHRVHLLKELNKPVWVFQLGVDFREKDPATWKAWSLTANLIRRVVTSVDDVKEVMLDHCEDLHISPNSIKTTQRGKHSVLTEREIKRAVQERTGKTPSKDTIRRARRALLEEEGVLDKPIVEVYTIPSDRTRGNNKEGWFSDGKHSFRDIEDILREEFDLWLEDMHDVSEYGKPMEYMTVEIKLNMRRVK